MKKQTIEPRQAVALKYDGKSAPQVVAKGHQELAETIIELAKEHDVFIHEDQQLVEFLAKLEVGEDIPESLYVIIAELIAFSFIIQGKFPEEWNNIHNKVDQQV